MVKTSEIYNKLREDFPFLDDGERIMDEPIMLFDSQIQMLESLFYSLEKKVPNELLKRLIVDIFIKPNRDNGKVYEALIYSWLEKHCICYKPQVHIEQAECFKLSNKGYEADGIIDRNLYFDVKQFGLTLPHIDTLRRKIQSKLPPEYYLTISGGKNISTRDLQTFFLEKIDNLIDEIMCEKNKIYTDYIFREQRFGLEFRLWNRNESSLFMSISEFDPYEWAENNEYYFLYHASQFCINSPYMLICPYDKQLAPIFSNNDKNFTFLTFRALCRRVFMNLIKDNSRMINEFDGKARSNISVASAAKKISAIVFVDVSEAFDYQNSQVFVFQNPNADCKIPKYQIDNFRFAGAMIENFEHDNY